MTPVQKYRACVLIVLAGSFYILLTDGLDRWGNALGEWESLNEKSSKVLSPDDASKKRIELRAELAALQASLVKNSRGFDQSEAGLVELVGESAKKEEVRIDALTPTKLDAGRGLEVSIDAVGSFHRIAAFINSLEYSPIAVKLEKLEITRGAGKALHVKMALKATFLTRE